MNFISAEAVVKAESLAGAAPLTTNDAAGSACNVAAILLGNTEAKRPRKVRLRFGISLVDIHRLSSVTA
jgi:hypothetical protein